MNVLTLGRGFVADHLSYKQITDRIYPHQEHIDYVLSSHNPDVIVNCIGKTGRPNIDWCQSHKQETYESNVTLPLMIAEWCENHNVHLIHIGSGCIYYGESPNFKLSFDYGWKETDFANPQSFYSKTKYACDLVLQDMSHITTLRIRMPISDQDVPRNLINKLRHYKQVIDIPNSVTFMDDLVDCIDWAASNKPGGIFHVVNPNPLNAAQIMKEYQKYVPEHSFEVIGEDILDQLTIAKRSNCILSNDKLTNAGFNMQNSETALQQCMQKYIENIRKNNVKQ